MNKEYTYLDGKVIIQETDKKRLERYQDNIDEILVQENLIEIMEERIKALESMKPIKHDRFIPVSTLLSIFVPPVSLAVLSFFIFDFSTISNTISNLPFQFFQVACLTLEPLFVFFGTVLDVLLFFEHKKGINRENGEKSELEYLKNQLVIEKERLQSLKLDKSRDCETTEFRTVSVDHQRELSELRKKRDFYYQLGYYLRKYYRLYLEGKLESALESEFKDEEIEQIREYVQEKGPMVMKPKKQQNK